MKARVLIACEESQIVTKAFREVGAEAFSCDIDFCSGFRQTWHIRDDVLSHLEDGWNLMIAHPPCTHLAVSGARWFQEKIQDGRQQQAIEFFMALVEAPIQHICIENPKGIMSTKYRKPDQIIQPWMFGHGETKETHLWLKNLPQLQPTNVVDGREQRIWKMSPGRKRSRRRSRTYHGIAKAMAEQWIELIDE